MVSEGRLMAYDPVCIRHNNRTWTQSPSKPTSTLGFSDKLIPNHIDASEGRLEWQLSPAILELLIELCHRVQRLHDMLELHLGLPSHSQ